MFRAARYHGLRLVRIKDNPRRLARGVFVGVLVSWTPFFGLHFFIAPAVAWAIGGNVIASLIAVLACNPLTFPVMAICASGLGNYVLGTRAPDYSPVADALAAKDALIQFWSNILAVFNGGESNWSSVWGTANELFLSYLTGGLILGTLSGLTSAWICIRVAAAFERRRRRLYEANSSKGVEVSDE